MLHYKMSVNISVSNQYYKNCHHIMNIMRDLNINCRIIETKSIVDKNIENECLITFGEYYNSKKMFAIYGIQLKLPYILHI